MEPDSSEELLFSAVERVIAVRHELERALAEYGRVYAAITGRPLVGIDLDGLLSRSKNLFGKLTTVGASERNAGNLGAISTFQNDGPRQGIRARAKEFLRQHSPHFFTAETIAKALGIKISSARYELYQLRKEKVVEKVGIDQWRFADSGDPENQAIDPKGSLSTSTEPTEKPNPPMPGANESSGGGMSVPPASQEGDLWYAIRKQVEGFFNENKGKEYSPEQIAATLGTDLKMTCNELESLKMEEVIENVGRAGRELYRYKKPPGET
jgi:hypothetical protein